MVMTELAQDLREEACELRDFVATMTPADWQRPSPFKDWTVTDVLRHLLVGDWFNVLAMTAPDRFRTIMTGRRAAQAAGEPRTSGMETLDTPVGEGHELLAAWYAGLGSLCDLFEQSQPRQRMPWAGPDMSIRSAATARLMETWAHAQDLYDMMRVRRVARDRIRHIAVLGVNTFAWTFRNRGLEPPGPVPRIELLAPSGAIWTWNDDQTENRISGPAVDFCHVVTQGRNIAEVELNVVGPVAHAWMAIAQCFAGTPENPPAPGVRGWKSLADRAPPT